MAVERRAVKFDLFSVATYDGQSERTKGVFQKLLAQIEALPQKKRVTPMRGTHYFIDKLTLHRTTIVGNAIRLRMRELPVKASLFGTTGEFDLESNEGMGEQTAFLYTTKFNVLVLQRTTEGLRASAAAEYFAKTTKFDGAISFEPMVHPDAFRRLDKMTLIRKFEISVAGLRDQKILKSLGASERELARLAGRLDAPTITIEWSMGYTKGTLDNVKKFVSELLGGPFHEHEELSKIQARGPIGDQDDIVDFLQDRLTYEASCEMGDDRRVPFETKMAIMYRALEHYNEVLKAYGKP